MSAVSVIIPNYNHAKYLKERIDSVLNQNFPDFEIIILDDCSTDESREIIESYRGQPKVSRIIYNEVNSGNTFMQWAKGIAQANSDWIWIAESDDWCEPTLLSELYNNARKYPDCVMAYCQSVMFENNDIIWKSEARRFAEIIDGNTFVRQHMLKGNAVFNASMCIFRKDTYTHIHHEFKKYKLSGDWIFWIEVALQGNVFISGKILNYFRKHPQDVSSAAFVKGLIYTEYFDVLAYLEKLNLLGNKKKMLLRYKQRQFLTDKRVNRENHTQIAAKFRKELGLISEQVLYIKLKCRQFFTSVYRLFQKT